MAESGEQPSIAEGVREASAMDAERFPVPFSAPQEGDPAQGAGSLLPEVRVTVDGALSEPRWEVPAKLAAGRSVPATVLPAVAAGSFAAGLALAQIIQRCRGGGRGRAGALLGLRESDRRSAKGIERVQIIGSRSLLLDVHLLGRAARER